MIFDGLEPWLVEWAERLCGEARAPLQVTSVRRLHSRQGRLYRRALLGGNPYPVAPPGYSAHELGLAWDMVGPDDELRRLGRLWQSWGGRWGGAVDPIHFEGTARMRKGGVI